MKNRVFVDFCELRPPTGIEAAPLELKKIATIDDRPSFYWTIGGVYLCQNRLVISACKGVIC
jgi:hypothetical protein